MTKTNILKLATGVAKRRTLFSSGLSALNHPWEHLGALLYAPCVSWCVDCGR